MQLNEVVEGLLSRVQLSHLKNRRNTFIFKAVFTFINGGLSIGLVGLLAYLTKSSFLFPSLGPTAFLLFYKPMAASASPRNTIFGHTIGIVVGWICFQLFEVRNNVVAHEEVIDWNEIGATSLSVAFTFATMVLAKVPHPPAAATTLLISMGVFTQLEMFPILLGGVILLNLQALVINRLAGLPYPVWAPSKSK